MHCYFTPGRATDQISGEERQMPKCHCVKIMHFLLEEKAVWTQELLIGEKGNFSSKEERDSFPSFFQSFLPCFLYKNIHLPAGFLSKCAYLRQPHIREDIMQFGDGLEEMRIRNRTRNVTKSVMGIKWPRESVAPFCPSHLCSWLVSDTQGAWESVLQIIHAAWTVGDCNRTH